MNNRPSWPLGPAEAELPAGLEGLAVLVRGEVEQSTTVEDSLEARLALLHVVRGSRALEALAQLIRAGYGQEGASVVRAIWEDAVSLAYLSEWPSERAVEWIKFAEERAARAVTEPWPPTGQSWWSGMGPSGMAKGLTGDNSQIGREFTTLYWRLCDDAHGSPVAAINYVVSPDAAGDLPPLLVGPSNHRVKEMAMLAALAASRLADVALRLGVQIDMAAVREKASEIIDAYNDK